MYAAVLALSGVTSAACGQTEEAAPPDRLTADVTVCLEQRLGPVNRLVLGHNVEAADSLGIFGDQSNTVPGRTGDGFWDPVARRPVPEAAAYARAIGMSALRYPGGCLTHNFDWKGAVGPVEARPDYAFGLMESLETCEALGAAPVITVSAYRASPSDAAELVAFLNAPASPEHPWAEKRAAWGHPEPYGVRWFEIGNEVDHGNHDLQPPKRYTPEAYARFAADCAAAMKAVDPEVEVGACLSFPDAETAWNREVLRGAGDSVDFWIIHTYPVGVWGDGTLTEETADRALRACLAAGDHWEERLAAYRAYCREHAGRELPFAITEYNASFVQDRPKPYRYSLAAALFSADFVRIMLQPESNVAVGNYWQFVNGYWGMVRGPRLPDDPAPWGTHAAYPFYRLWHEHLGEELLAAEVDGPTFAFEGFNDVTPASASGEGVPERALEVALRPGEADGLRWEAGEDAGLRLALDGLARETYPEITRIPVEPDTLYELRFEARGIGMTAGSGDAGLGLVDVRGWDATRSGNAVDRIADHEDWQRHSGGLLTLPDATEVSLLWRLRPGETPMTGTVAVRNLEVVRARMRPAVRAITATATQTPGDGGVQVFLFNKHPEATVRARVHLAGPADRAETTAPPVQWTVSGPSLDADNRESEQVGLTVAGEALRWTAGQTAFEVDLPPLSMTAAVVR